MMQRLLPIAASRSRVEVAAPLLGHSPLLGTAVMQTPLLTARRFHGNDGDRTKPLSVHFELPDGTEKSVTVYEGQTLLDIAAEHGLPMEGACGGSCACSTCHVYVDDDAMLERFPEPTDAENDMIDQAFFPEPGSRLGCQLHMIKSKHDGMRVRMPKATRNMYVDGAKVVPH